MSFGTRARRWVARGSAAAIVAMAASAAAQVAATAAQAGGTLAARHPVTNPYAPAYGHPYRRGAVPTQGTATRMATWQRQHPGATVASPAVSPTVGKISTRNVQYGGGNTDGQGNTDVGVTTGHERVYLVFYGSQWGTPKTSGGITTFSKDPSGEARYVQKLFKGLGTGGEHWSGVMTQYCQDVSLGAQTCPSSAPHVAYPTGGALAGVWADVGSRSPAQANANQLAQQAASAAAHFGNTTAAANRDAQYIILSPHGTDPDQYKEVGFCAWHDYTGDSTLDGGGAVSPGYIAFTNMPYVTDAGANCGVNFIPNGSNSKRDGISIVVGHEYAETITDQDPPFGWVDSSGNEVADKCAWKKPGTPGGVAVLKLPTGSFAMQGIWANNANSGKGACRFAQTIKT
jgi:hypothetical protein